MNSDHEDEPRPIPIILLDDEWPRQSCGLCTFWTYCREWRQTWSWNRALAKTTSFYTKLYSCHDDIQLFDLH